MGLWAGWNPTIKSGDEIRRQIEREEFLKARAEITRQNIKDIKRGTPAERLRRAELDEARLRFSQSGVEQARRDAIRVGREAQAAVGVAQPVDFTPEQEALQSMFGGGAKIWGTNMTPVHIHNDLNPRQRGDFGTAQMFGF